MKGTIAFVIVYKLSDHRIFSAERACRILRYPDFSEACLQRIIDQEFTFEDLSLPQYQLQDLCCLQTADDTRQDAEHTGLLTGRYEAWRRRFFKEAAVTGPVSRHDGCHLAL